MDVPSLLFEGCLTFVDVPSDRVPNRRDQPKGSCKRVVLTRAAAAAALATLAGKSLNYQHDASREVGIIDDAWLERNELRVRGRVFAAGFPEITLPGPWGMSFEMEGARVEDLNAPIWRLVQTTFTAAAVLRAGKAAYSRTWFRIVQSAFVGQIAA